MTRNEGPKGHAGRGASSPGSAAHAPSPHRKKNEYELGQWLGSARWRFRRNCRPQKLHQGPKGPKMQGNARKCTSITPKFKEMKAYQAQNCKMEPGLALLKSFYGGLGRPYELATKKPKCKEIKTQKAKMQGNEGPKSQNARK